MRVQDRYNNQSYCTSELVRICPWRKVVKTKLNRILSTKHDEIENFRKKQKYKRRSRIRRHSFAMNAHRQSSLHAYCEESES